MSRSRATRESGSGPAEHLPAAYAAWRGSTLGRVTDTLEQDLILDLIGPASGLRILELGCGDGELAVELAARGASVVGIDASPQMIAAARDRAAREGREGETRFKVASIESLSSDSEKFDVVVAVAVLCFVEDVSAALRTAACALRPGGRLIVGELGRWMSSGSCTSWKGACAGSLSEFACPFICTMRAPASPFGPIVTIAASRMYLPSRMRSPR